MSEPPPKSPSIRSVASNSSLASGTSLSRRSRTRTRSRTVTGLPSRATTPISELPYLDAPLVQEPVDSSSSSPMRPPRSPNRLDVDDSLQGSTTPSSQGFDLPTAEVTMVEPLPLPSPSHGKPPKVTELVTSLPVMKSGYKPPPSAFSRDPAFTPNVRDSVSTHQSGGSSSLYPPSTSTSTTSGPDSPISPRFMAAQLDDYLNHAPVVPEIRELEGYDGDDVAYRLQLLVKNNYFLPPAHSKPSAADFAASDITSGKKPVKPSTPAFLDLFRSVKPKSKPNTPTGSPNPDNGPAPMLRTTADSITTGHLIRSQQAPRTSTQTIRPSPQQASRGRVVVVREKMADLAVAAKQAEQDLKSKGLDLVQASAIEDVIDPTDAVDLPPPSASYPFAVQASALRGLGVKDSVGAALLADRLPPPKSSNNDISSSYDIDEDWRKALLHQAVGHSLDSTPDISIFSHGIGASSPVHSGRFRTNSAAPTPTVDRGPPQNNAPTLDKTLSSTRAAQEKPRKKVPDFGKGQIRRPPSIDLRRESHTSIPERVNTPMGPMTPLAPPPRKNFASQPHSNSQTNLTSTGRESEPARSSSAASHHTLRKSRSSPLLSDHDSAYRNFVMTPPPVPGNPLGNTRFPSYTTATSYGLSFGDYREGSIASGSYYSEDEYDSSGMPRSSLALSAVHGGRPSLSEYSQSSFSPTTSAFQDVLNHGHYYGSSSSLYNNSRGSLGQHDRNSHNDPRHSTTSPPPRMSSSLAHAALPPPPRSANHPYQPRFLRSLSVDTFNTDPDSSRDLGATLRFDEPEPTSPPLAGLEIPSDPIPILTLDTPRRPRRTTLASTTSTNEPASDTSFFDSIQSQPNAMDDLESSSDESEDEIGVPVPQLFPSPRTRTTSTVSAPVPRSPIMRLGNHSVPYVSKSSSSSSSRLGTGVSRLGVGNVALKPQFFSDRKSDSGHPMPSVTYDFIRNAQENSSGRSSTEDHSARPITDFSPRIEPFAPSSWRAQESFRKLDGMLLQHMETEKDTIKRIATTAKQNNPPAGVTYS